jgi:hypothetical protein
MFFLFLLALLGLVSSFVAHVATFAGINPEAVFPQVWLLHVGIFVVWIPTVVVSKKYQGQDFWKASMRFSPVWLRGMCGALFTYALFNFFFCIFVLQKGGVPSEIDGKKVLHSHGSVIRELTDEEYERHRAYGVRTFSGHWMLFYGVATGVLYSQWRATRLS